MHAKQIKVIVRYLRSVLWLCILLINLRFGLQQLPLHVLHLSIIPNIFIALCYIFLNVTMRANTSRLIHDNGIRISHKNIRIFCSENIANIIHMYSKSKAANHVDIFNNILRKSI